MVRDARKASQNLLKKGFLEKQGRKHVLYIFIHEGKKICETHMSRDDQDLNDYLLDKMSKQVYLDKKDFIRLIDCPLSEKDYTEILKSKNLITD